MTEIGFIVQPEDRIPADVTWVEDRAGDAHERDDEGQWHQEGIGNDPVPWDDEQLREWGPLTVSAVREQPAEPEPRCPECGCTSTQNTGCNDAWHTPDVLDLVRQYGTAAQGLGYSEGVGQRTDIDAKKSEALFARIEAEVQRLRADTAKDGVLIKAIAERADEFRTQRDEARAEVERWRGRVLDLLPDPSAPLVLSLPKVPEGAVALVTRNQDGDEVRFVPAPKRPGSWVMASGAPTGDWLLVEILRTFDGSVSVVMREPRTWPALPGDPEGVNAVRGKSGRVYRPTRGFWVWREGDDEVSCDSFASLQNYDGPLVEVFDDKDGTK